MNTYITYILQQNPSYRVNSEGKIFAPIGDGLWRDIVRPDQHQSFDDDELFDLRSVNSSNNWKSIGPTLGKQRLTTESALDSDWKATGKQLDRNWKATGRLLDINKKLYRVEMVAKQVPEGLSQRLLKDIESIFLLLQKSKKASTLLKSLEDLKEAQTLAFADDVTELSYYRNLFSARLARQRTMKRTNTRLQQERAERRQLKVYLTAAGIILLLVGFSFTLIKLSSKNEPTAYPTEQVAEMKETPLSYKEKLTLVRAFEIAEGVEVYEWRYEQILKALNETQSKTEAKKIIRYEYYKKY